MFTGYKIVSPIYLAWVVFFAGFDFYHNEYLWGIFQIVFIPFALFFVYDAYKRNARWLLGRK